MPLKTKFLFGVLLGLATIGLVRMFIFKPLQLFGMIAFLAIVLFLFKRFAGLPGDSDSLYQKALRQQKKKNKTHSSSSHIPLLKVKKKRSDIPFKVIEGKKTKKDKDREEKRYSQ